MATKLKMIRITTPKGRAKYPWLNKPSTMFNKNEYKTALLLDPNDPAVDKFINEQIEEFVEESYQKAVADAKKDGKPALAKQIKKRYPYKQELDKETGEETGLIELNFTTSAVTKDGATRKVPLFDAQGKPCEVAVGGGSVIKINAAVSPYYMAASKEAGIKFYLNAVQVLELVTFGGGGDASLFGFEADDEGSFVYSDDVTGYGGGSLDGSKEDQNDEF